MSDTVKLKYKPLIGQSIPDLESFAESQGEKPFRGRQLFDWIYRQKVYFVSTMPGPPKSTQYISAAASNVYKRQRKIEINKQLQITTYG